MMMDERECKRRRIESSRLHEYGIQKTLSGRGEVTAVIKHRYSDFLVNEIVSVNGEEKVVRIRDLKWNAPSVNISAKEFSDRLVSAGLCLDVVSQICLLEGNKQLYSEEVADKETRTLIHQACREFGGIDSKTFENRIEFSRAKSLKINWNELGGEYLHFTLYKENRDTAVVLQEIAKKLQVASKDLTVAGTKDKRGITTQRVCGRKIPADKLSSQVNGKEGLDISDKMYGIVRVGDFTYKDYQLQLGDLVGNRFEITLRDCQPQCIDSLTESIRSFRQRGYINYFGLQRFGTKSDSTHSIGRAVLLGNMEEAINLIMRPKDGDKENVLRARLAWQKNNDVEEALKLYPRFCVSERAILTCFSKTGKVRHAATAFSKIPKNIRLMYLHAYQSYVWNHMASKRIDIFGPEPVIGDIVLASAADEFTTTTGGRTSLHACYLTESNISKYTIQDVVLPMPGWDILYPKNSIGVDYRNFMKADGLDIGDMKRKVRDHSLPGTYRKLIGKAENVAADFYRYSDDDAGLSRSDIDVLNGVRKPEDVLNGDKLAIVLRFELPKGSYATMAVREICECQGDIGRESGTREKQEE